jgi:hypothetical protein
MPKNAEEAAKTINEFNPEAFQNVLNFAKSIGINGIIK